MPDFEITAPDGRKFIVTAPEGASQDDVLRYAQQNMPAPPDRGIAERALRTVGLFGQGLNSAVGGAVGAIPDASGAIARAVGLPAHPPGYFTDKIKQGLAAIGPGYTPENAWERGAQAAGGGAGLVASFMLPATVAANAARAGGAVSNVAKALTTNPGVQLASGMAANVTEQATDSPWLGMAAGLALPAAVAGAKGAINALATNRTPEQARLTEVAARESIPLTHGQSTGSAPLRTMESVMATLPSTAGRQEGVRQVQREAFNQAVLRRAGENQRFATPDVINTASQRIGQTMGDIAARNTMKVDATLMQGVHDTAKNASRYLPDNLKGPVLRRVDDFINKIDTGNMTVEGKAFAALDSELSRHIRGEQSGLVRDALRNLQTTLRMGMNASISGQDAQAWQEARRQYANLMIIQDAMNQPNLTSVAGNIPPKALSQVIARGPQDRFARGFGDLNDLSRVGRHFVSDPVPDSGTAQRLAMQALLTGGAFGGGSPTASLGAAAAGLLAPRAVQEVYLLPWQRMFPDAYGLLGAAGAVQAPRAFGE